MILVIDNYDSFTYNLVQCLGEMGAEIAVFRNDQITPSAARELQPSSIVISPGPGRPEEAGASMSIIRELGPTTPVLGVCLGHQAIGAAFGGTVVRAPRVMHGKTSPVYHRGDGIFRGVPSPFEATRYHSLVVRREGLPRDLEITAETEDGTVMALRHREYPIYGVQFHPESILTSGGKTLLRNFLDGGMGRC